jgi:hypothetical protein
MVSNYLKFFLSYGWYDERTKLSVLGRAVLWVLLTRCWQTFETYLNTHTIYIPLCSAHQLMLTILSLSNRLPSKISPVEFCSVGHIWWKVNKSFYFQPICRVSGRCILLLFAFYMLTVMLLVHMMNHRVLAPLVWIPTRLKRPMWYDARKIGSDERTNITCNF